MNNACTFTQRQYFLLAIGHFSRLNAGLGQDARELTAHIFIRTEAEEEAGVEVEAEVAAAEADSHQAKVEEVFLIK